MKFSAMGAAALLICSAPAFAADLPARSAPPVWTPPSVVSAPLWTGFYVGLNAGAALNLHNGSSYTPVTGGTGYDSLATTFSDTGKSETPFTGGAQVGYNMTYGALLVGAEADFNYVSRKSNAASVVFDPAGYYATTPGYTGYDTLAGRKAEWFGTVRARAGMTFDRFLVYATGGLAYGQVGSAGSLVTTGVVDTYSAGSTTSNRFGYALGAGIEYALNDMWTLKGEYLHVQFKDTSTLLTSATNSNFQFTARTKNSLDLVRLGVNMRF